MPQVHIHVAPRSTRCAANDDTPTITFVVTASFFGGYDVMIRSHWDGERVIEVGADLLDSLEALATGRPWAEGGDHTIGRTGRDKYMLRFDKGENGPIYLEMNHIQLEELTTVIRGVQPDGSAVWWDMLQSAA